MDFWSWVCWISSASLFEGHNFHELADLTVTPQKTSNMRASLFEARGTLKQAPWTALACLQSCLKALRLLRHQPFLADALASVASESTGLLKRVDFVTLLSHRVHQTKTSPELAPVFFWGGFFGVPLFSTDQAKRIFFCWGPDSSLEKKTAIVGVTRSKHQ